MPRGGVRKPGPGKTIGRPRNPNKKIRYSTVLKPDIVAWLKDKNAAYEIEKALYVAMDHEYTDGS